MAKPGVSAQNLFRKVNECYGDITPTISEIDATPNISLQEPSFEGRVAVSPNRQCEGGENDTRKCDRGDFILYQFARYADTGLVGVTGYIVDNHALPHR